MKKYNKSSRILATIDWITTEYRTMRECAEWIKASQTSRVYEAIIQNKTVNGYTIKRIYTQWEPITITWLIEKKRKEMGINITIDINNQKRTRKYDFSGDYLGGNQMFVIENGVRKPFTI